MTKIEDLLIGVSLTAVVAVGAWQCPFLVIRLLFGAMLVLCVSATVRAIRS